MRTTQGHIVKGTILRYGKSVELFEAHVRRLPDIDKNAREAAEEIYARPIEAKKAAKKES